MTADAEVRVVGEDGAGVDFEIVLSDRLRKGVGEGLPLRVGEPDDGKIEFGIGVFVEFSELFLGRLNRFASFVDGAEVGQFVGAEGVGSAAAGIVG